MCGWLFHPLWKMELSMCVLTALPSLYHLTLLSQALLCCRLISAMVFVRAKAWILLFRRRAGSRHSPDWLGVGRELSMCVSCVQNTMQCSTYMMLGAYHELSSWFLLKFIEPVFLGHFSPHSMNEANLSWSLHQTSTFVSPVACSGVQN